MLENALSIASVMCCDADDMEVTDLKWLDIVCCRSGAVR